MVCADGERSLGGARIRRSLQLRHWRTRQPREKNDSDYGRSRLHEARPTVPRRVRFTPRRTGQILVPGANAPDDAAAARIRSVSVSITSRWIRTPASRGPSDAVMETMQSPRTMSVSL